MLRDMMQTRQESKRLKEQAALVHLLLMNVLHQLLKIALEIEPKHADSLVARAWIWQTSGYDKKTVEREYQDLLRSSLSASSNC